MLVLGNGLVGRGVAKAFAGSELIARQNSSEFDLANPAPVWKEHHKYGCIAAAMCNVGICEKSPKETYFINVTKTLEWADLLLQQGITPVLFSSDYVFDGSADFYTDASQTSPINEYGRQKANLERLAPKEAIIVRLSKVVAPHEEGKNLFTEIFDALEEGRKIKGLIDHLFCPVSLQEICQSLQEIFKKDKRGLVNVTGNEVFSRYDYALKVAHDHGFNPSLIEPLTIEELGLPYAVPKRLIVRRTPI